MSEKQKHNPEASTQALIELYKQAADYLETAIHTGAAITEPAHYSQAAMLKVTAHVPMLNGNKIALEYDRPAADDDPSQVDRGIPLAWSDETGGSHWQTPIRIQVTGPDDFRLNDYTTTALKHDYTVEYAGDDSWARVTDNVNQPWQGRFDDARDSISALEAKEVISQIEWGLEGNHQPS